ncbi:MAG: cytochrome c3 family protein [Bacteroidales bacterium]
MRILSLILVGSLFLFFRILPDNPHGKDFKLSCSLCHSTEGWKLDKKNYSFDHNTTKLPLTGQHVKVACKQCHPTLVFTDAGERCNDCHRDVHQATVGDDCLRCHTTASWLVTDITAIHQRSRFPLYGVHRTADCSDCHLSENSVRFDVPGVNCIDCHRKDYMATTTPNHAEAGFSEDCVTCHPVSSQQWTGAGFNHNFFALAQGHSGLQCNQCHTTGKYSDANPACNSCHQTDFSSTTNPNHTSLGFSTTCNLCHSLAPGWKPAAFTQHDSQSFPIYSGRHRGTWTTCTQCHPNPSSYSEFTCLSCHEHNQTSMNSKHQGRSGYSYTSAACLHCHPRGVADDK